MRNALAPVSRSQHTVAAAIRQAFDQPAAPTPANLAKGLRAAAPALAQARRPDGRQRARCPGQNVLPRQHRTKQHPTDEIECLNNEVKRPADLVGIFPNEASIPRLIGVVFFEQNDERQTSSRYMMVEVLTQNNKEEIAPVLGITMKAA